MIGLDTNVLLRWLLQPEDGEVGSSAREIERVAEIIRQEGARFFVNAIVLAEVAWILEQKLKLPRGDVGEVVDRLIYSHNIVVGHSTEVRLAQQAYAATGMNFADCLIMEINLEAGCTHTLTFDRKASKGTGFRHVDDH